MKYTFSNFYQVLHGKLLQPNTPKNWVAFWINASWIMCLYSILLTYCFLWIELALGRGRGRGSYQQEAPRGRFGGRTSGRGIYQDSGDYRSRGNGVRGSYWPVDSNVISHCWMLWDISWFHFSCCASYLLDCDFLTCNSRGNMMQLIRVYGRVIWIRLFCLFICAF